MATAVWPAFSVQHSWNPYPHCQAPPMQQGMAPQQQAPRKRRWAEDAYDGANASFGGIDQPAAKRAMQQQAGWQAPVTPSAAVAPATAFDTPFASATTGSLFPQQQQLQLQQQQQQQPFPIAVTPDAALDDDVIELDVNPQPSRVSRANHLHTRWNSSSTSSAAAAYANEPSAAPVCSNINTLVPATAPNGLPALITSLLHGDDDDDSSTAGVHKEWRARALLAALRRAGLLAAPHHHQQQHLTSQQQSREQQQQQQQHAPCVDAPAVEALLRAPGAEAQLMRLAASLTPQQQQALATAWRDVAAEAAAAAPGASRPLLLQQQADFDREHGQLLPPGQERAWDKQTEEPSCLITELSSSSSSSSSSGSGGEDDGPWRAVQGTGGAAWGGEGDEMAVDSAQAAPWLQQQQQQPISGGACASAGGFGPIVNGTEDMMVD